MAPALQQSVQGLLRGQVRRQHQWADRFEGGLHRQGRQAAPSFLLRPIPSEQTWIGQTHPTLHQGGTQASRRHQR